MPHFHIDYSPNLEGVVDVGELCEAIRAKAVSIDTFPMPGVRVRATAVDHYAIADGNPKHGFVDISVRLREGRSLDVKKDAIKRIFETAKSVLAQNTYQAAGHQNPEVAMLSFFQCKFQYSP